MNGRWTLSEVAAVSVSAVAYLVVNTLPAITGVLARDLGFTAPALGAFGSAEVAGGAAGAFLAVIIMRYASPRLTAMSGLALLCAGDACSVISGREVVLVGLRALGGVGTGLATSACAYVFSLKDRERNYAASLLSMTGLAATVIAVIPRTANEFGWRGLFLILAFLAASCLIFSRTFPGTYAQERPIAPEVDSAPPWIMALGLIAVSLFGVGQFALWTYLEQIGAAAGIPESSITASLSISTVFGLLSSGLVLFLGQRVTRRRPVAICVLLNVIGAAATASAVPLVFMAGVSAFYFSLPIYSASLFGAVMRRAPSKRFAAKFSLATSVGAVGPAIGGVLAEQFGLGSVRWLDISFVFGSAALLWIGFLNPFSRGMSERAAEVGCAK